MKLGDLLLLAGVAVGGYFIVANWATISATLNLTPAPATGGNAAIPSSPGGIIPQSTPPAVTASSYPNLGNGAAVQAAIAAGWTQTLAALQAAVPTVFNQTVALAALGQAVTHGPGSTPGATDASTATQIAAIVTQYQTCIANKGTWNTNNQLCSNSAGQSPLLAPTGLGFINRRNYRRVA
jgi:hypothetical protein